MNNLDIYNKVSSVPDNAKKPINAGRLKGMTDINPMWRIKTLTETFGVCGFGWKYVITNKCIIDGANDTKCAFVDIDLFVKLGDEWSEAIPGTGGSSFIAAERNGLYTSDECFKMALTDAISVACKALGIGADVYYKDGQTKYSEYNNEPQQKFDKIICPECGNEVKAQQKKDGTVISAKMVFEKCGNMCFKCWQNHNSQKNEAAGLTAALKGGNENG